MSTNSWIWRVGARVTVAEMMSKGKSPDQIRKDFRVPAEFAKCGLI